MYVERGGSERLRRLIFQAECTGKVAVKKVSRDELEKMCPGVDLRGALLDLGGPRTGASRLIERSVDEFLSSTDPHNLGAILRSADQFSVDLVIIPERRSVQANETVIKVSSGSAQYVPLSVSTNLSREIEKLKANGFWVYAADMDGERSYGLEFSHRTVLVMGSEGKGISPLIRKNSDYVVSIPMSGHIDSLNVSVATGILLYEFRSKER